MQNDEQPEQSQGSVAGLLRRLRDRGSGTLQPDTPEQPPDAAAELPSVPPELRPTLDAVVAGKDDTRLARATSVAEFAAALAGGLRLARHQREELYQASFLHALLHDGPPSTDQRQLKRHLQHLEHTLTAVDLPDASRQLSRHHHEHFNGRGFPGALGGEAIPLQARILLVTEAFAAMSFQRSYQRTLSVDEALQRLEMGSGSVYDPFLVRFLQSDEGRRVIETAFGRGAGNGQDLEGMASQVIGHLRQGLIRKPGGGDGDLVRSLGRQRRKALAGLAVALVLLAGGAGLASASSDALPGDSLYPVKRTVEDLQLLVTTTGRERNLHLDLAKRRLDEANGLIRKKRNVPDSLLKDLAHETDRVSDSLDDVEGARRYEVALQLRDHGERAEAMLLSLNGVTQESRGVLAAALTSVRVAAYIGAVVAADHETDAPGKGQAQGNDPDGDAGPAGQDSPSGGGDDGQSGDGKDGRPGHAGTPGAPPHANPADHPPGNSGDAPGKNK